MIETLPNTGSGKDVVPPPTAGGGGVAGEQEDEVAPTTRRETGAGTAAPQSASAGSLPFTGFDAGLIALMGLALVATGVVLRRSRSAQG